MEKKMTDPLAEAGFTNKHKLRVLWTDSDPAGINFYGNFQSLGTTYF